MKQVPKMRPKRSKDARNAHLVAETARLTGVSKRQVYRVLSGHRTNDEVLATYGTLSEGTNALLKKVELLVPFLS